MTHLHPVSFSSSITLRTSKSLSAFLFAILSGVKGLTATVLADGLVLREYDDPDADRHSKQSVQYIEAKSGAKFEIATIFSGDFPYRQHGRQNTKTVVIQRVHLQKRGGYIYNFKGILGRGPRDDADIRKISESRKKQIDAVGSIEMRLYRTHAASKSVSRTKCDNYADVGIIPEKALKGRAISHKLAFGDGEPTTMPTTISTHDVDPSDKPFASFTFKCRSMQALKASFIVPRSPTPVPLEDRPVEELTMDELRELLRRERAKAAATVRIKREVKREREEDVSDEEEYEDDLEDSPVCIVEERPRKAARTGCSIAVIDLTDD
ncbi:hypothetical protein LTS18_004274 [Coniosporium uncinatum]|uniref:Uncharacterized protein n=1 Tax=Coniosporium uncinatum TaxID=93489 RepID=A0ACC3E045_9PEZI|nr:hypothetical protein LTS18_004274 [Coniosporium uncinatum]